MSAPIEFITRRFVQAVKTGEDTRKLRAILEMSTKEDLMNWTDEHGLDLLHHSILLENAEAADFLLKQGYFVRPYQPNLDLYLHLAALLGNRALVTVLMQHRPDDFRVAEQPLLLPPGFALPSKQPETPIGKLSVPSTPRRPMSPSRNAESVSNKHSTATSRTSSKKSSASTSPSRSPDASINKIPKALTPRIPTTPGRRPESGGDSAANRRSAKVTSPYIDGLITDGSKSSKMTPLEVAARARNIDCVRVLLDLCILRAHPDAPSKGYMTLAALANCPPAMTLVIKVIWGG